jgi:hypothetical protein
LDGLLVNPLFAAVNTTSFAFSRLAFAGLCLAAIVGLSSCTSAIESRITKNPQLYNKLKEHDRALVSRGEIREGMTKEAVFLSWGRADHVSVGRDSGRSVERWGYTGSHPVYTSNLSMGFGSGYYGGRGRLGYGYGGMWDPYWGGYGPSIAYVPYQAATVEFRNGRVIRFMRAPEWLN